MNGPKVVLRYSDPIPFTLEDSAERQEETMRYISRWMVANAIGDTRSFDAIAAVVPPFDLQELETQDNVERMRNLGV